MNQEISLDRLIEFVTNHRFLFIGLLVVTILLIQDLVSTVLRKFRSTSPTGAIELLNEDAVVLDIREPFEFKKGHIANAINIPYAKLNQQIDTLEPYKSKPLIVTCKSGTQSAHACKKLSKAGFQNVYLMQGGMQGWQDINLPIERTKQNDT